MDLRAVDRDYPDLHETLLHAEREHLTEQACQCCLVALAKPRDRRVIRHLVCRDHTVGDVLHALVLDHPRGALPLAVGVEQQRDHHRWVMGRAPMTIGAIGRVERRQIHRLHRGQHKPREVIRRQPLAKARRHQQHLLTITRQEVLGHAWIVLTTPDSTTPFCNSLAWMRAR
jgi:hypothetical protein